MENVMDFHVVRAVGFPTAFLPFVAEHSATSRTSFPKKLRQNRAGIAFTTERIQGGHGTKDQLEYNVSGGGFGNQSYSMV